MQTLKKKNLKNFKPKTKTEVCDVQDLDEIEELDEVEELDEFVNGMGAGISGDAKNVNNSEIKTAPQATTADFAQNAIQPRNRYYNAHGISSSNRRNEGVNIIAKDKMIKLLEFIDRPEISSKKTITDYNNNAILDINELPSNVARKLMNLVDTAFNNNLSDEQINLIIKFVSDKLKING
tara:strand:+ start:2111 stop:2650 length:540 start_codon:yes stop_codon:yes gene_type:complete